MELALAVRASLDPAIVLLASWLRLEEGAVGLAARVELQSQVEPMAVAQQCGAPAPGLAARLAVAPAVAAAHRYYRLGLGFRASSTMPCAVLSSFLYLGS